MKNETVQNRTIRHKRTMRVRKKLRGTADRPRLCVVKSNKHIHVQLIDDEKGVTLGSTTTCAPEFRDSEFSKKNKASAAKLGKKIAEIAKQSQIEQVVFDRGPFKFHGILAALANSAREAGLKF